MLTRSFDELKPLDSLRLRWGLFALLSVSFLIAGYFIIAEWWQPVLALRWACQTAVSQVYLLWVLWSGLEHNYRDGENRLLPALGWGNVLTLFRGSLIAALLGFVWLPRPSGWLAWIPGLLYTTAAIADGFDGYLARKTNHATRLGERLDISMDGVGVLAAALLAVLYGRVPGWYLLVGLARYLFLLGVWARQRLHKPVYPLPPSIHRRTFAGIQMGFLFVILWPVFSPPATHIAATFFAIPFLTGFARDWLIASGVLRSDKAASGRRLLSIQKSLSDWLPIVLRAGVFLLSLFAISQRFMLSRQPVTAPGVVALGLLEAGVALLLVLGAGGRSAAVLGLCLLGANQMIASLTPVQIIQAALYTAILYLGTGAYSLWKPEDRLIYNRAMELGA